MIKLRDARYCNLKLFLLYLVLYGHWIEPQIYDSEFILYQYKFIYGFHMPLFAFLSGLFIRNPDDCVRQIKKILPIYLLLQGMMTILKASEDLLTPYWVLWYLLSDCLWLCFGWIWFRIGNKRSGYVCLGMLFLIGALAGYIPWLDRTFSGSRSIVFLPYFFMGLLCSTDVKWKEHRRLGALAFACASCLFYLFIRHIPVSFLYQAGPFGTTENSFLFRCVCYAFGILLCFFFLTFAPGKRFPFTKMGADTLPAYLLHAPVVFSLRQWNLSWETSMIGSAILIYAIYKLQQWTGAVYGIIPLEGGNGSVRISRNL